jgi:cell division protein FtsB
VLPNIYDNHKKIEVLQQEKEELLLKNRNMEKKLFDIKEEIERLNDEFYVETLSRERLNMVKEDEKIYRLVN